MFDPSVFRLHGIGLPSGVRRPEFGPDAADLQCHACAATWVGNPCDPCRWCAAAVARHKAWAAESVLTAPEGLEPNAVDFDQRVRAWARRLKAHVNAGVITRDEAESVLQKAVGRRVA
jgi:phosphopantetheinyl transferase